MQWFDVLFNIIGYPVTIIEFISVIAGITAVYLAAKEKTINWPIGLINIATAFFIYYHVQLYSDMFLQCYYFVIAIYGWYTWRSEKIHDIPLKTLSTHQRLYCGAIIAITTLLFGLLISNLHTLLPDYFPIIAAYPYADSFVAVMSVVANTLLAKRYIENWILWIFVNIISVYLYYQKEIYFISFEFLIFLLLAVYGFISWMSRKRELNNE